MPDLDRQLAEARRDLLDQIQLPELGTVHTRAAGIRRRRRTVTGAVAAAVLAIGLGTTIWPARTTPDPAPIASPATASPSGWRAGGITVLALNGPVLDLPGDLYDVRFASARVGFALAKACPDDTCDISYAETLDGGATWRIGSVISPYERAAANALPTLQPVGTDGVVAIAGDTSYFAAARTYVWIETTDPEPPTVTTIPAGGQLWVRPAAPGQCTPAPLRAWTSTGQPVVLAHQPALQVCRVAPARAADGAWWVGGRSGGQAAVAVSRDNGATWTVTRLPAAAAGAWAQVSTLGPEVYASVVSPDAPPTGAVAVHAVYRSVEGGAFTTYADSIGTVVGDVVALLDGRLVAANGSLQVSDGRGTPLHRAGSGLPAAASISSSAGASVAYDVFLAHWVAVSTDGETWQKINLH